MTHVPTPDPTAPLLDVRDLRVTFTRMKAGLIRRQRQTLVAVDGISLQLRRGETLGLVGESGCGKSTLGRAILQLVRPAGGQVRLGDTDLCQLDESALRPLRRQLQMVFQDPFSSLNPRMTVGQAVAEPMEVHRLHARADIPAAVADLLTRVGLGPQAMTRFPHEFSGGQRQRVGIARALASQPELLICDEPVSALDVSIQAQIVNLLDDLRHQLNLSCLFIAHDLAVVRHLSDRVAVMYLGRIVELADKNDLYERPLHPYTRALLDAVPSTHRARERSRAPTLVQGEVPSPLAPPPGCHFHPRCPQATDRCRQDVPRLAQQPGGSWVACHLYPATVRVASPLPLAA